MDASYLIGNLLGRLFSSYLLVWLVCFGFARADWRGAFVRTRRWYGILAVATIFALGLAAGASRGFAGVA